MNIVGYILFILMGGGIFFFSEKIGKRKIWIIFLIILLIFLPILFLLLIPIAIFGEFIFNDFQQIYFKTAISVEAVLAITWIKFLMYYLIEIVKKFHIKYNTANIDKVPVVIFTEGEPVIKKIMKYAFFIVLSVILYGLWFSRLDLD